MIADEPAAAIDPVSQKFGPENQQKRVPAGLALLLEASTGFEPVMRVLQTLALPLGHDAEYTMRIADWNSPQSAILHRLSGR